jgi:AmmeMemoRadiSam system protein A
MSRLSENLAGNLLGGNQESPEHRNAAAELTRSRRQLLLRIARSAIASGLTGEPLPDSPTALLSALALSSSPTGSPAQAGPVFWPGLVEHRGVFTTLYLGGQLRGCVGYALPIQPLYRAVGETARAAAFEDTRFWPLTPAEAPELKISLSVLSPLFPIAPGEVEVGRHGLLISDGMRRGLLLPQVSVERGWDRETFLAQTCRKAGLPEDAWQKSTTIEAFTAEVFGDDDVPE